MTLRTANRVTTGILGAALLLLAVAPPAAAQAPPGTEGQFSYRPTQGARGDSIFFDAKCLWGGSGQGVELDVSVYEFTDDPNGTKLGSTVKLGPDGVASGSLTIPADARPGQYKVFAGCHAADQAFFASEPGPFTVTGPPLEVSTTTSTVAETTSTLVVPTSTVTITTAPPDPNEHELARTGSDIGLLAVVSVLMIVVGYAGHRRSRSAR